jgi:hypothetical protein
MTAKEHNRLAGIFLMAHGGLQLFSVVIIFAIWGMMVLGFIGQMQHSGREIAVKDADKVFMSFGVAFVLVIIFAVLITLGIVIPQIVGGYKLLKEKPNARTWGIVGSILSCMSFPIGTAAGVYGLWFLFGDMGKNFYLANNANQNMFQNPPPPQNWA